MYKLMIVDDEYMILEGLKQFLNYTKLHIEIVYTAETAEEALTYLDRYPVDIVLTDVTMPGMNGLEMIDVINQKEKQVHFIVMSGYQEFDYVKKSMTLGVTHYLVKPINQKELEEALVHIVQNKLHYSSLALDFLKGMPIKVNQLLDEITTNGQAYLVASKQPIPSIISLERHVNGDIIHFSIIDKVMDTADYLSIDYLTDKSQFDVFKAKIEKILFYGHLCEKEQHSLWDMYNDLYPSVMSGQIILFLDQLPNIQHYLAMSTPDVHLTQQFFIQLLMDIYQHFNQVGQDELQMLFTSVKHCKTLEKLIQFVSKDLLRVFELHRYSENVKKVLSIISEEYETDLTLKIISQRLFINTVYLGQLIKKETSLTFAELLNKQRVKVAQQLLLNTVDSVESICYKVGYSNVGYFYKTFKRLCGESPNVYRQQFIGLRVDLSNYSR